LENYTWQTEKKMGYMDIAYYCVQSLALILALLNLRILVPR